MIDSIRLSEYRAVLEDAVLEFVADELESERITFARAQEMTHFMAENIEKPTTHEELSALIDKLKENFPELKETIEKEISEFELHKKYTIA
jgi:hypothetical protein